MINFIFDTYFLFYFIICVINYFYLNKYYCFFLFTKYTFFQIAHYTINFFFMDLFFIIFSNELFKQIIHIIIRI